MWEAWRCFIWVVVAFVCYDMSRLLYLKNHMNVRICALLWCFLRCVNNSRMVLLAVEKPVRVYGIACIGVRERLYGCAEKPISACWKGFVRTWYGLFRSVEKAFSRVRNGRMRWRFFQYADIQCFMLSIQNHHIVCRFFEYADMRCLISSLQNSRIRWRDVSCWSVRDSQRVDVILFFSQSLQYGADMWRLSI